MPRLNCTFAEFIAIIMQHGFVLHRQSDGSHAIYRGVVGGKVRLVTVASHLKSDSIKRGTLMSMVRSTGSPKALFRS